MDNLMENFWLKDEIKKFWIYNFPASSNTKCDLAVEEAVKAYEDWVVCIDKTCI